MCVCVYNVSQLFSSIANLFASIIFNKNEWRLPYAKHYAGGGGGRTDDCAQGPSAGTPRSAREADAHRTTRDRH